MQQLEGIEVINKKLDEQQQLQVMEAINNKLDDQKRQPEDIKVFNKKLDDRKQQLEDIEVFNKKIDQVSEMIRELKLEASENFQESETEDLSIDIKSIYDISSRIESQVEKLLSAGEQPSDATALTAFEQTFLERLTSIENRLRSSIVGGAEKEGSGNDPVVDPEEVDGGIGSSQTRRENRSPSIHAPKRRRVSEGSLSDLDPGDDEEAAAAKEWQTNFETVRNIFDPVVPDVATSSYTVKRLRKVLFKCPAFHEDSADYLNTFLKSSSHTDQWICTGTLCDENKVLHVDHKYCRDCLWNDTYRCLQIKKVNPERVMIRLAKLAH
ncbi:hypothetical protein F5Y19DRAFT_445268 [Xylariaceae sp. FL1651]|nr:hypothetical protein F5Y19DRAFT_445268 [Xylariaceae sp. FL1651]